ncbi:MAG: hypothetical protein IPJ14_15665 [Kineosporiaceae bacterium]|nr:hypothetical protein [Kineosporiaceae bacterium]MBK7624052.1 hypothetical protein [Kineosporiaceae bacterium]MBK8075807.1 hypothetical protein [Kineosporiaceae bacterium]
MTDVRPPSAPGPVEVTSTEPRPGPIHDNALRQLAADELLALCRWLGIPADPGAVRIGEAFPSTTRYADLLVGCGPGRLAQVEFVRRPTRELPWRLLEYRARIMRLEPECRLSQHIVVLAGGRVQAELSDGSEVWTRFHVTYLREQDPAELLADPALAPLAPLARVQRGTSRPQLLRQALQTIRSAPEDRVRGLAALAIVLAAIHLDPDTIETARRETAMPISLEGTVAGRILEQRAEARGRTEGEAHGRTQGEIAAVIRVLNARFGSDPRVEALARRLVGRAGERAIDIALAAAQLDDLDTTD